MSSSQDLPMTGTSGLAIGGGAAAIAGLGAVLKRMARTGARIRRAR